MPASTFSSATVSPTPPGMSRTSAFSALAKPIRAPAVMTGSVLSSGNALPRYSCTIQRLYNKSSSSAIGVHWPADGGSRRLALSSPDSARHLDFHGRLYGTGTGPGSTRWRVPPPDRLQVDRPFQHHSGHPD